MALPESLDTDARVRVASLTEHPGWNDLKVYMDAMYEKEIRRVGLLALQGNPGDSRELAIRYGWWRGVRHLLSEPANALTKLERELARKREDER